MSSHSKKKKPLLTAVLILLIAAAVVCAVIFLKKSLSAPADSAETSGSQTETRPMVPDEEIIIEQDYSCFTDKQGAARQYFPEEDAARREYEAGMPKVDDFGNPVFEKTDPSFPDYEMIRGIDVSAEQGEIDWLSVRNARCDFAMICADEMFDRNYEGAYASGLRIGVYYCSDAADEAGAREDAKALLSLLSGREIDLFTAIVPEKMETEEPLRTESLKESSKTASVGESPEKTAAEKKSDKHFSTAAANRKENTLIVKAFCEVMENAGYRPAVYSSMLSEATRYDMTELAGNIDFWYSDFGGSPETPYPFSIWQYCLTGGIPGISGPVHLDILLERPYEETETEKRIYSYTQFSREAYETTSWVNKRAVNEKWTGDWAKLTAGGQEFMMFGCGICCLSNMVSTLTGAVVPPDEMFADAREHSYYHPESGKGAISWESLQTMCGRYGLKATLRRKPSDYETFVQDVSEADTVTVLVCGDNDKRLWWYTDGHYVNIWDYDPAAGTVFVTDPAIHFNRRRVKLQDIYNALKTASACQYAAVRRK